MVFENENDLDQFLDPIVPIDQGRQGFEDALRQARGVNAELGGRLSEQEVMNAANDLYSRIAPPEILTGKGGQAARESILRIKPFTSAEWKAQDPRYQRVLKDVQKYNAAFGGELTAEEADKIAESLHGNLDSGGGDQSVIQGAVSNLYSKKAQAAQQEQIDRAANPQKYLSQDQLGQNQSAVNDIFQSSLGRAPTQYETEFYSGLLAEGEKPYELQQFIQTSHPEYLKKQADTENQRIQQEATASREALGQQLLSSQQEAFNRAVPNIISQYMKAGRLGSSGLNSAVANAQADLERERQGFLATAGYEDAARARGYRREDFLGNQTAAFQQYLRQNEPAYQQRFAVQGYGNAARFDQPNANFNRNFGLTADIAGYGRGRTDALADRGYERQNELEDYTRQQADYNRYLSQQRRDSRRNALLGFAGSLLGSGLQAYRPR